jgi:single-stranded-DNA-specific exonuclease
MHYSGVKKKIVVRSAEQTKENFSDIHPLLQRIFLSRGIKSEDELDCSLRKLPSPWLLSGMETMVTHLIDAIENDKKVLVIADFDADGATSCTVAVKGLSMLGVNRIEYIVPSRFEYGYGLTPGIVNLAAQQQPDMLLTVDNGISSIEGVKLAKELAMTVLITDHHLPGEALPAADAIVNPNLPDDTFPGGALAGVGVMFYVLMALRSRLRDNGWFTRHQLQEPNLGQLLDFVALGTVADVVPLDQTNRVLVQQGLLRIRANRSHLGLRALIEISGRNYQTITASDLGYALGPRLNAAGRLDNMSLGIEGLLTDDEQVAKDIALQLDDLNSDRREIEGKMKNEANILLREMKAFDENHLPSGVCLFDENWHQGVIGILASRIKDRLHRPVIAFAPADNGEIKGSARSIPGVHIRDVLSEIATVHPNLLNKFGGHAMAAGMSLKMSDYPPFALAFNEVVRKRLQEMDLDMKILSDGQLSEQQMNLEIAELLQQAGPWGQEFPEPLFDGVFDVIQSRIVGQHHLKLVLRLPFSDLLIDAIAFYVEQPEQWLGCRQIKVVYQLDINEYKGNRSVQFILQYLEKIQ